MALKTFKPTTPSQRQLVIVDRSDLYKGAPVKALTEGLRKSGGRNNHGHITARRMGGGHKRRYRTVDFKRRRFVVRTERLGLFQSLQYPVARERTGFLPTILWAVTA